MEQSGPSAFDPYGWYRDMRRAAPVARASRSGAWLVFGYDDVQRVLSDHEHFSSTFGQRRGQAPSEPLGASIIATDPPRHRQLRALVTQAFTPRAVARLEPRIRQIVHDLIDRAAPRGEMDMIADLAAPLPVTVIAELLGIPAGDREQFKRWSDAVVTGSRVAESQATSALAGAGAGSTTTAGHVDPQRAMAGYFQQQLDERRREPRDDLLSALLEARVDGETLSELELLGFCILLLVAGNETTTNLIGNAMLCLRDVPELAEQLRREPERIPMALEEVLRFRSPVQSMFRVAAAPSELGGRPVETGDPVVAWIASANRDALQFPEPDRFDAARTPNRHLAFGHGIHFCLGAPLARLEGRIALEAIVERLRGLHVAGDAALRRIPSTIVYGLTSLPVTFGGALA